MNNRRNRRCRIKLLTVEIQNYHSRVLDVLNYLNEEISLLK